ncbi:PhzF family phenazine biosynthesis protein [Aestuariicoccus sp. MJ-SS9]|uniref:PhzF family phenazine biosynthesis protein n=1 Tax=Aestuariicoccus sp. MJ-SS9 TaxID=3079855 RepID=UPI00290CCD36|nr:PhzF family phenazine biosynthesis protein [Aestuariicoccus sp. MJ-SS9]MDU8911831.1 PhzF family phenazine biosynthesis protein [Aestuariicoccus sp. MJ-SS9]
MPDQGGALAFATLDVFTDGAFSGNPLAVVLDADGLTTDAMQTIAREFNLSETIFVQRPADPANTAKVRIFFPTAEIPFAGHPTIGCALYLAQRMHGEGDIDTVLRLEEEAGLVPVRVWCENGARWAELTAPVVPHAATRGTTPPADLLARAIGLGRDAIGFGTHAPAVWEGGPRFLYIPVGSLDALAEARPHEPTWSETMTRAAVDSAYLYTPLPQGGYRARMFSPTAGIPEDPDTGSASAILAAQLLASGDLAEGETRVTLQQGVEMGRPSRIALRILTKGGALDAVHVAGQAVDISDGRIRHP